MTVSKAERAFHWIVDILQHRNIPFQISGGLAARVYGSTRPLNDIDIDVPDERLEEIVPDVREWIQLGPLHLVDERWDLQLMVLNYNGQPIDVCGARAVKICDVRDGVWKNSPADLSTAQVHEVFGIRVPVAERRFLADYKQMLAGEHQVEDVRAIRASLGE
jgi:hypothetical protein